MKTTKKHKELKHDNFIKLISKKEKSNEKNKVFSMITVSEKRKRRLHKIKRLRERMSKRKRYL
jgi:hypothetical protein